MPKISLRINGKVTTRYINKDVEFFIQRYAQDYNCSKSKAYRIYLENENKYFEYLQSRRTPLERHEAFIKLMRKEGILRFIFEPKMNFNEFKTIITTLQGEINEQAKLIKELKSQIEGLEQWNEYYKFRLNENESLGD